MTTTSTLAATLSAPAEAILQHLEAATDEATITTTVTHINRKTLVELARYYGVIGGLTRAHKDELAPIVAAAAIDALTARQAEFTVIDADEPEADAEVTEPEADEPEAEVTDDELAEIESAGEGDLVPGTLISTSAENILARMKAERGGGAKVGGGSTTPRIAPRGRYQEALEARKAAGNGARTTTPVKVTDLELAEYMRAALAADPEAVANQVREIAYWLDSLSFGQARWTKVWEAVIAEATPLPEAPEAEVTDEPEAEAPEA